LLGLECKKAVFYLVLAFVVIYEKWPMCADIKNRIRGDYSICTTLHNTNKKPQMINLYIFKQKIGFYITYRPHNILIVVPYIYTVTQPLWLVNGSYVGKLLAHVVSGITT
jgi:hypothetical protein